MRRFATQDEAVAFVGMLEGVENGIYYIDPPTGEDSEPVCKRPSEETAPEPAGATHRRRNVWRKQWC